MQLPNFTMLSNQLMVEFMKSSLKRLPLHEATLNALDKKLNETKVDRNFLEAVSGMVFNFERASHRGNSSDKKKLLEGMIYQTYFVWNNPPPEHLMKFKRNYLDMLMFWPYERHRSLLNMESPKRSSMRYRWDDNNKAVLSMMRYEKNPWLTYSTNDNLAELSEFKNALGIKIADDKATDLPGSLTNIERDTLFNSIFTHYFFLKSNPRLCSNGKNIPLPIVEIPMRPLGQDIAAIRIRNLFKKKVSETWRILSVENPVLSKTNEQALATIISGTQARHLRRLYQKACKRAYVIDEPESVEHEKGEDRLLKFKVSSLLLKSL